MWRALIELGAAIRRLARVVNGYAEDGEQARGQFRRTLGLKPLPDQQKAEVKTIEAPKAETAAVVPPRRGRQTPAK